MHIWRNGTEFCVLPFDLEVSKLASMRQSREFFPWPRGVATSQCTFVVVVYCLYSLILLKLQRTSWFDTFPAFYCHQKTIQVVKDMAPINLPFTLFISSHKLPIFNQNYHYDESSWSHFQLQSVNTLFENYLKCHICISYGNFFCS